MVRQGDISGLLDLPASKRMSARPVGVVVRLKYPFMATNVFSAAGALVGVAVFAAVLASVRGWLHFIEAPSSSLPMVPIQVIVGLDRYSTRYPSMTRTYGVVRDGLVSVARFYGHEPNVK